MLELGSGDGGTANGKKVQRQAQIVYTPSMTEQTENWTGVERGFGW